MKTSIRIALLLSLIVGSFAFAGCFISDPAPVCEPPCTAIFHGEEIVDCYCPREKW